MITVSGYQLEDRIYENAHSLIYRAHREADGESVILKLLKDTYPSPEQIEWFKREYEITRKLDLPTVVQAHSVEKNQQHWMMVLEDFGGESLNNLQIAGTLSPEDFLILAIEVTEIVGKVHQHRIIHKDINPANILVSNMGKPETTENQSEVESDSNSEGRLYASAKSWLVKLTDFGIATDLSTPEDSPDSRAQKVENESDSNTPLEGTLAYIAPEQTGRVQLAIDYRTDFYALGATFYELITGQPPFVSNDPLELIHAHLAKQPPPPHQFRHDFPVIISQIVLKLMAKNPDERYQSAYGLKADLQKCLLQWQNTQRITPFPLGETDVSDKFKIPQKLYGRSHEIDQLLTVFSRVSPEKKRRGETEMVLITGPGGAGKSALVENFIWTTQISQRISQQNAFYIAGKFDQLQPDIPYASLLQAFRSLVRQLLTQGEQETIVWREKLLKTVGDNGQVLIEVLPELELIIGEQQEPAQLGPAEARNRFNLLFRKFIKLFATPQHPLIFFLDDLQWADTASLKLLKLLVTSIEQYAMFLIGAYRDDQVTGEHPLLVNLAEIRNEGGKVSYITLPALPLPDITTMVAETLHCETERAAPLAKVILEKTQGNPFFISEFLKSLHSQGLIWFDYRSGWWRWDLEAIQKHDITDNVVNLMADKVQRLPPESQQLLQLAACLGHRFDLESLATIAERPSDDLTDLIWPAVSEGLVLLLRHEVAAEQFDWQGEFGSIRVEYKFAHDRVQQAVYSLIPMAQRAQRHWQIGQLLLENTPQAESSEKLFDIVNHLNLGRETITEFEQFEQLAGLNLRVGQRARSTAAYQQALNYFNLGLELLNRKKETASPWERQYKLTLALHLEGAEAAYLATEFEEMERLAALVLKHADSLLDKMQIYEVKLRGYIAKNELQAVMDTAFPVLRLLAVRFPPQPTEAHIQIALKEIEAALAGRRAEDLLNLPRMTDPYRLAAMRILTHVSSAAYFIMPELLPLLVFKLVTLSVKHGNSAESALAYATYGLILCGRNEFDEGYQFGDLSLQLMGRLQDQTFRARALFEIHTYIRHWKEHVRDSLQPLQKIYRIGLETGDLEHAARARYIHRLYGFFCGEALPQLEQQMASNNKAIQQLRQERVLHVNQLQHQVVLNLLDSTYTPQPTHSYQHPHYLSGPVYDEAEMRPRHEEAEEHSSLFTLYLNKLILAYLFKDYETALHNATLAEPYINGVNAMLLVPLFYFYDSLVRLAVFPPAPPDEKRQLLERVVQNQQKLEPWAIHAPMNHLHKYYLVQAEKERLLGYAGEARERYDQAIKLAQKNHYINEEALAQELAGRYYLHREQEEIAAVYLGKAHYAYLSWGALAKVKAMELEYPQLTETNSRKKSDTLFHPRTTTNTATGTQYGTTSAPMDALDLSSVLRASQTISSEIMLDALLEKMIKIVIENAGAERGILVLNRHGSWMIEAEGYAERNRVKVLQGVPVASQKHNLATTVINYVVRAKEAIVLHDAANENQFLQDPYIQNKRPKSLLCTPLIHQSKVQGLLYLENNLTVGAFTSNHLKVLNLLSSQAAISIQNAQFYAQQIEFVKAYSRFVPYEILQFLRKESIVEVELGDQIQEEMTVLFSDIRSFTSLSEKMSPQENFNFINSYLSRVSPIIRQHDGFIDKYIGDAIMALFPRKAEDAIQASIEMQRAVDLYNRHRANSNYQPISIGIGLHTGKVMLGTIGEEERMEATVISDTVNLASRIEGLNKLYGAAIVMSEQTLSDLGDDYSNYHIRFLDRVQVKGKSKPVSVFEVLDGDPSSLKLKLGTRPDFEMGLFHYQYREFSEAKKYFLQVLKANADDKAAELYLRRIEQFLQYGVPVDWEGVASLTEK